MKDEISFCLSLSLSGYLSPPPPPPLPSPSLPPLTPSTVAIEVFGWLAVFRPSKYNLPRNLVAFAHTHTHTHICTHTHTHTHTHTLTLPDTQGLLLDGVHQFLVLCTAHARLQGRERRAQNGDCARRGEFVRSEVTYTHSLTSSLPHALTH